MKNKIKKIKPIFYEGNDGEPRVTREKTPFRPNDLKWDEKEARDLEKRIINLHDDQIVALFFLVGIAFFKKDIPDVLQEIRKIGEGAIGLGILLDEADSKENLFWWVDFFTKANRDKKGKNLSEYLQSN